MRTNDETTHILTPNRLTPNGQTADPVEDPVTTVFNKCHALPVGRSRQSLPPEERTTVYLGAWSNHQDNPEDLATTGQWKRPTADDFDQIDTEYFGPAHIRTAEIAPPPLGRRWLGLAFIAAMLVGAGTGALLLPVI